MEEIRRGKMEIVEDAADVISCVLVVVFMAISLLSAAGLDMTERRTVKGLKQMQI